jgi:peptidoglycan hydrolase-like protein with peptidoglycan-binding domain
LLAHQAGRWSYPDQIATQIEHPARRPRARPPLPRKRWLLLLVPVVLAAAAWAVVARSGVTLAGDPTALARLDVQAFGGSVQSARATAPSGKTIPLTVAAGRLTPNIRLTPGERIAVDVVVRRPGALAWALGKTRHERLVVTTPVVHPESRWIDTKQGSPVTVAFDGAVAGAAYDVKGSAADRHTLRPSRRTVSLGTRAAAGTTTVAVAARTWERLQPATTVSWFPKTSEPAVVSAPADGAKLSPLGTIRLTFARTVKDALGDGRPSLSPRTAGRFTEPDDHTLVFTPSGTGFGIGGGAVRMTLPKAVALASTDGAPTRTTRQVTWTVPPASTTRLQQLLAQGGYLPVSWTPSGADVARTRGAQAQAAVDAPSGTFSWRYANTPGELKDQWVVGQPSTVLRGAIMKFQDTHHLTVDGLAGPALWSALLADTVAGKRNADGYTYVYVHRDTPQKLILWHNGRTVLTTPGNTGVPGAPTKLGTFPVFEHIASTTMRGTNPDGSHYDDAGVKWVSYFNGGDALHAFNRASYGTPQSVGCVELPEAAAKQIWPYTPIGTLVTIEH